MGEVIMKKIFRKSIMWVIIILSLTIIFGFCIKIGTQLMFSYTSLWKYSANYEDNADDFHVVKNYIEAEFSSENDKWLSVSSFGIYDPDTNAYLQLPSEVALSLQAIYRNGFPDKDANFDIIRIHSDRISFGIENGRYALVYSPNQKPSWLNSPNEDFDVRVKPIKDGWYHVVRNPG